MSETIPIRTTVAPSIHPTSLVGDSDVAKYGRAVLGSLYTVQATIVDAVNDSENPAEITPTAVGAANRALTKVSKAKADLQKRLSHENTAIGEQMYRPLAPELQFEIRSLIRESKSPLVAAMNAIEAGEKDIAVAILSGPALLSGLTHEQLAMIQRRAELVFCPEQVAARNDTARVLDHLTKAGDLFSNAVAERIKKHTNPNAEIKERLENV